ncbi:MAG: DUF1566 domain-containing protein [Ignavibacteriae bacterium HGW-Ignavibacteriae-3]|nr:MAG: DUF1566 domain-containing protein [Ignavibacteriae bacterium HGW-Ignavibacteriae-3]
MEKEKKQKIIAWIAVSISAVFANLWAFWGIIENFHEGWYFQSFWQNIFLMFIQYLLMPLGFMILAIVSVRWNKIGSVLHLFLAAGAYALFGKMNAGFFFVIIPLISLSLLYWFGRLEKRKLAYIMVAGLPLLIIFGIGIFYGIRVSDRYNDNNFETRLIKGNGVELTWAPQGPGWPDNGTSWFEAKKICAHLSEDGKSLSENEINIWRLPTVDEAVRSLVYRGTNAGGVWDEKTKSASYKEWPDKESPLWNMYLKTIYWWTSTEVNDSQAYIIVYNGGVWPRDKKLRAGYLNFRAVKEK